MDTRLQAISDVAVQTRDREKVSATQAVMAAIRGHGLNREQVHRVCSEVNRRLLKRSKESSGHLGFPDRWETAKPDKITKGADPTKYKKEDEPKDQKPRYAGDPKVESLGDSDMEALQRMLQDLQGEKEEGDLETKTSAPRRVDITRGDFFHVGRPDDTVDDDWRVNRLAALYGIDMSEKSSAVVEEEDPILVAQTMQIDYLHGLDKARTQVSVASIERSKASAQLADQIDTLADSGLTLGEALYVVKMSFDTLMPDGWDEDVYSEVYADALQRHEVDVDLVLQDTSTPEGRGKESAVRRERQVLLVRSGVIGSELQDLDHPLVKASAAFLEKDMEFRVAESAAHILEEKSREVGDLLDEVLP